MRPVGLHLPSNTTEAITLQRELARRLVLEGDLDGLDLIAGVDASSLGSTGIIVGAVVVWSQSRGEIVDQATTVVETEFPYIPGLLAFRELPSVLESFNKLKTEPHAVICDGQGTAHMRGFGIACHLGLYLGIPTVGCGKSRLIGTYVEPGIEKGAFSALTYKDKEVGRVVRTRTGVKPVFVSPGHLCGLGAAVRLILECCTRYKLPEPIRAAHNLSGESLKASLRSIQAEYH